MIQFDLFKVDASIGQLTANTEDFIKIHVSNSKTPYRLYDEKSSEKLYKDLTNRTTIEDNLMKIGINSARKLANLIMDRAEVLKSRGWNMKNLLVSKGKRGRKTQQISKEVRLANTNSDLSRVMVVYDVNNPWDRSNIIKYEFVGKHKLKDMSQLNGIKSDWAHRTGLNYMDARPIFLANYNKKYR